ncbi:MAG TPA: pantoate--beta-alanine ligase [Acidimicrobiales bacterium]|nr:pantoate--beta-alanine ligase [Acidimicrobiales bacterium]
MTTVRLIGPGRAGRSLAAALVDAGCDVRGVLTRHDDPAGAAHGVDVLVIATPDGAIAETAARVEADPATVVVHLSGAQGLDVLGAHRRRASLHPLVPLPSPEVGRVRLRSGITFAVAGDPMARALAELLGGRAVVVDDGRRAAYHASACIAANHLVGLMGQVERVAATAGLDLDAFLGLARAALTDVAELGPARALTGPAARGDEATLAQHRRVLDRRELAAYDAGVELARRLARSRAGAHRGAAPLPAPARARTGAAARPSSRATRVLPTRRRGRPAASIPVVRTASAFAELLDAERAVGRTVGLVPTMGALHAGHEALVDRAARECDVVAVTVFVNPLQFDDAEDLAAYPRALDADVERARLAGASVVFAPPVEEMYPGHPARPATVVHVDGVSEVLEGASRPGHFDGVATVVAKLFALSGRCRAYFGEKDFQQLAVVRAMTEELRLPVEVVGCPTVREPDGLALSSRNARLSPGERHAAGALSRALRAGRARIDAGERDPGRVEAAMRAVLVGEPLVEPDYAVVVDPHSLVTPATLHGEVRLLVAARVGPVRLIDNDGARCPAARGDAEELVLTTSREDR